MKFSTSLYLVALLLSGCGGGGGGGGSNPDWYYHFSCNGDSQCLSLNPLPSGTPSGNLNQGPGTPGQTNCNSLVTFGNKNWNIPPAEQYCDTSPDYAAPTVTLTIAPSTINLGQSATLTWSSTHAQSCTGSDAWSGSKGRGGNLTVTPSSGGTLSYTLTCSGPGGSVSTTRTLTVIAPSVAISVAPSTITDGASSTLSWSSSNANACTASGAWKGTVALSGSQPAAPSTGSYTYTIRCTGASGAVVTQSATLTVNAAASRQAAPTVTISLSPTSVGAGGTTTVTWDSQHATSCEAQGAWAGDLELSGSTPVTAGPPGSYDFTISCNGSGGSATATATLTVPSSGTVICSPVSVNISASPSSITEGQGSTLTWSATPDSFCSVQSISCVASGAWSGSVAASGTLALAPSAGTFSYGLTCSGRNSKVTRTATLTVASASSPSPPTVTIAFSPPSINLGESSTLSWSATNARSCTASGAWTGAVGLSGSRSVTPSAAGSYSYGITCLGSNASVSGTDLLGVEPAAGTTSSARFNFPYRLVVNAGGDLFVADTNNDVIRRITSANVVTVFAGLSGMSGAADGSGANARFNLPYGIGIDPAGLLYVADTVNKTIRSITSAAAVSTLAGTAGSAGSSDGSGAAARFNNPYGVATDSSGNVYVADTENHLVRKITAAGVTTTLAGTAGVPGSADGTGTAASFNQPRDVTVDSSGNVYVADSLNCTVRRITPAGVVTTLAGSPGQCSASTDGTGSAARFTNPVGIVVDSTGNLFVADQNSSIIRKVTTGGVVTTFAGSSGNPGSADGTGTAASFRAPAGLAVDASNNLYVADTFNCMIRKITPAAVVSTVAGVAQDCRFSN